ncbi:MAG: family 43 glycosylhydrolase [Defluviitaleaceae bacterium]|nr:family 43 glycosylhydrolase [Defluviitaleaceae bacterium]
MMYEKFTNGPLNEFFPWADTSGDIINASDGGVIYVDGVYYWYGQALRPLPVARDGKGGQTTTVGVVMYKSADLYNWDYCGVILPVSDNPTCEQYAPMRYERPKIVYNDKAKKFVLWCHYVKYPGDHGDTKGTAEAGIAVCDNVDGTYQWLGTTRPIDEKGLVRDSTLYKDHDGTAYFIYDKQVGDDRCLHIVKLSEDYLSCTDDYRRIDVCFWREAAAIVFYNGWYFMFTSGLTSWDTNPALYYRARSLMGGWEAMGDPCIGDVTGTTFESQSTFIFPVEGNKGQFILMCERHNTQNFERCSYIWLPINFPAPGEMKVEYLESWCIEDYWK